MKYQTLQEQLTGSQKSSKRLSLTDYDTHLRKWQQTKIEELLKGVAEI